MQADSWYKKNRAQLLIFDIIFAQPCSCFKMPEGELNKLRKEQTGITDKLREILLKHY